jgi:hypothetical protein
VPDVAKIPLSAIEDAVQAGKSMRFEASNGIGKPTRYRPSSPVVKFRCSSPAFNPVASAPNMAKLMKLFDFQGV